MPFKSLGSVKKIFLHFYLARMHYIDKLSVNYFTLLQKIFQIKMLFFWMFYPPKNPEKPKNLNVFNIDN